MKKLRVILTGVTGMVGEGVLHECLLHPGIESVLSLSRKPSGVSHPKLKEITKVDFYDLSRIEESLKNYDACFFCLGTTSIGKNEKEYSHITYDMTLHMTETLLKLKNDLIFCYISGAGTDGSEAGRSMWARVKGKTENDLKKLPFKGVYLFRPGYMQPIKGLKNALPWYKYMSWMYPFLRLVFPNFVHGLNEMGLAMINCALQGYQKQVLEVKDIKAAAKMAT